MKQSDKNEHRRWKQRQRDELGEYLSEKEDRLNKLAKPCKWELGHSNKNKED